MAMQKKMKAVTFFAVAFALCSAAMAEDVVVNWVTGNVGNYTEFPAEGWTKSEAGVAELAGDAGAKYVTFESAYDDPLFYAPSGSASKLVSVEWAIQLIGGDMAPTMAIDDMGPAITATTPEDESDDTPAQWYGYALTNSVEAGWVKLFGNVPSNEVWYTVRIEQGMVDGDRMIRYSVKPAAADVFTVLKDEQQHEWFADPRGDGAGLISANFVGCGAFGNFKIDNTWFTSDALAGAAEAGFDWTNATVTVTVGDSYSVADESPITLELKVYDAAGTQVGTYEAGLTTDSGKGKGTFYVGNLTPGGNYSYEVVAKVGDEEVASFARNGNLVSANAVEWIYENSEGDPLGGAFDPEPQWNGGVAQLSDAVFAVTDAKQKEASNRLVRIENTLMGSELCDDLGILEDYDLSVIQGAMLAYVDPETGVASWLGVVTGAWVTLTGAAPVANQKYVVRVDFDFTLAEPKVRYSVSADDGVSFETLRYENAEWLAIASEVAAGKTVTAIELPGSCSFYGMKGDYYDAAVAEVGGTKYYTLEAALEAALTSGPGTSVKLLTNLTYLPGGFDGTWTIAENGKTLQILTPEDGYTYTYAEGTLTVVAQGMCVENLTTGYQHLNLKAAQARAEEGDILQLLDNVGAAALAIEKSFTLDLHGFSVTNDAANTQLFVLTNNVTLTLAGAGALTDGIDVWAGSRLALSNNFAAASESVVALELKGEWAHEDVIAEGVSETQAAMLAITPEKIDFPAAGNGQVEYREEAGAFVWAEIPPSAKLAFARTDGYDLTNLTVTVTLSDVEGDLDQVVIDLYNEDGTLAKRTAVYYVDGTLAYPIVLDGYTKGAHYTFNAYVLGGDSKEVVGGGAVAGSFYAGANGQIWFRAKPGEDGIINGEWEEEPEVGEDGRYVLDGDEYVFTPTEQSPSNAFVTVDWQISFDQAADADLAFDVDGDGAFSLFAAGTEPETYQWKGLVNGEWVELTHEAVPAMPSNYLVHADFDYTDSAAPKVSYAFIVDGKLYRLADSQGEVWFTIANSAGKLVKVSAVGTGKLDVVEGFWSINAVASIGDVFYDTIDAAAAAGKDDENKVIKLLTNVTWAPTESGTYYFNFNGFSVQATDNVTWNENVATVSGGEMEIEEMDVKIKVDTSFIKEQVPGLPADATPAEVAEALKEPGANGYKLYESYVLGLDPKDEFSKPVLVDELSAEADKVDVQVLNVSVNAKAGVEVTYSLLSDTDPEFKSGEVEELARQAVGRFEVPLPGDGEAVKYYKVNFYFSNPTSDSED